MEAEVLVAKFRVLEVRRRLKDTTVILKPVIAKGPDWPHGSEENAKFWQATPSGELELTYSPEVAPPLKLGEYCLLHVWADTLGIGKEKAPGKDRPWRWKLWGTEATESTLTVKLGMPYQADARLRAGNLRLGIENQEAWPLFDEALGGDWLVQILVAEEKPYEITSMSGEHIQHPYCPYTDP